MKKWEFGFCVREWFLSPKDWDQYYEPGDSRECVSMFCMDSPDENLAREKLHKDAEAEDIMLEILGLEFKQEVEVSMPQKPISKF